MRAAMRQGGEVTRLSLTRRTHPLAEPGGIVRHFRLDAASIPARCCISCTRSPNEQGRGLGEGPRLHLRHPADQYHPPPGDPRCRCRPERRPEPRRRTGKAAPGSAQCLHDFNRDWSRRVLGSGRGGASDHRRSRPRRSRPRWAREMQRLALSARQVIWVNPLLRWDGFAPRAQGIRAMLPHVDQLPRRPQHRLARSARAGDQPPARQRRKGAPHGADGRGAAASRDMTIMCERSFARNDIRFQQFDSGNSSALNRI